MPPKNRKKTAFSKHRRLQLPSVTTAQQRFPKKCHVHLKLVYILTATLIILCVGIITTSRLMMFSDNLGERDPSSQAQQQLLTKDDTITTTTNENHRITKKENNNNNNNNNKQKQQGQNEDNLISIVRTTTNNDSPATTTTTTQRTTTTIIDPCNKTYINPSLTSLWSEIDAIVSTFPSTRVSGGIFLYPHQSSLLSYLIQQEFFIDDDDDDDNPKKRPIRICETGFGAGHSAALFLSSTPERVQLLTFDKFDRPYQKPALELLKRRFGEGRVRHVEGDSCRTVPRYFRRSKDDEGGGGGCDFMHGSSLCGSDNIDLVTYAARDDAAAKGCGGNGAGTILTSTAMHSITDRSVYFGKPRGQWRRLRERGCIANITCFKEDGRMLERDFVFNKNVGAVISHEFCIAVTTGVCGGGGGGGVSGVGATTREDLGGMGVEEKMGDDDGGCRHRLRFTWMEAGVCSSARIDVPS